MRAAAIHIILHPDTCMQRRVAYHRGCWGHAVSRVFALKVSVGGYDTLRQVGVVKFHGGGA